MKIVDTPKFIADINVGRLARWLRAMGYDTLIFKGVDDSDMVTAALVERRIILTRDTQVMKRRLISSGQVRAILIRSDRLEDQLKQVINALNLPGGFKSFALCLECNEPLIERDRGEVKDMVPVYVYETQNEYMECPICHRIYWKGTHWQRMTRKLEGLNVQNR